MALLLPDFAEMFPDVRQHQNGLESCRMNHAAAGNQILERKINLLEQQHNNSAINHRLFIIQLSRINVNLIEDEAS